MKINAISRQYNAQKSLYKINSFANNNVFKNNSLKYDAVSFGEYIDDEHDGEDGVIKSDVTEDADTDAKNTDNQGKKEKQAPSPYGADYLWVEDSFQGSMLPVRPWNRQYDYDTF